MWLQIYALPELDRRESDTALLELWMTGLGPGLTRFSRLMNLAVLLRRAGRADDLRLVLGELHQLADGKSIQVRVDDLHTRLCDSTAT
jgi:hypothetical protein